MKTQFIFLIAIFALCWGVFIGVCVTKAQASDSFWSGTAKGMVVPIDTTIKSPEEPFLITPYSVGKECYNSGTVFDLKNLEIGQVTYLNLYVRNNSGKTANVYPVYLPSKNLEVSCPMGNSKMWPGGWTQFVFIIKAINLGECKINIGFVAE